MIIYYAMGAGLGHISRALTILKTLNQPEPVILLTNSQYLIETTETDQHDHGLQPIIQSAFGDIAVKKPDAEIFSQRNKLRDWLQCLLQEMQPDQFFIDTFPAGIKGEIDFPLPAQSHYIARILKWEAYGHLVTQLPYFQSCHILERLHDAHFKISKQQSKQIHRYTLPPTSVNNAPANATPFLIDNYCLILHSGPWHETQQLIAMAQEHLLYRQEKLTLLLASPQRPIALDADIHHVSVYPATNLMASASAIVSAAGYNSIREMQGKTGPHWYMPFHRRFDDQFFRAEHYQSQSAG